jgi:hypothetical protein
MPFLAVTGSSVDAIRNTAILALVSGVYFWRAKTEEKHLSADPDYRAYADWMGRYSPMARLVRTLTGWLPARKPGPGVSVA